ncbi:hypothetical protein COC69_05680 [Bacillus cereus]|uniref:N-acetylmuramoyl-L-alanine amidase n=1 Tax=Bacillus cereus TaxID=1396 RepID=A0A9X7CR35_BACCE|nr:CHAP domain-containing protein [Bacillus cereus]PGS81620.1 hypothetical protein COC69_05680 [Bacillus cereus]
MSKIYDLAAAKVGQVVDFDGVYGGQCADLSTYAVWYATGARITGNAIDTGSQVNINAIKAKGVNVQILQNSATFIPQKGDIMVENPNNGGYGHVSIVESATLSQVTVFEQNYYGTAQSASPKGVERRTRSYLPIAYFVRIADPSKSTASGAGNYLVTADVLNVRSEASTAQGSKTVVATYKKGQTVYINSVANGWGSYVSYSGAKRYVSMDYLKKV